MGRGYGLAEKFVGETYQRVNKKTNKRKGLRIVAIKPMTSDDFDKYVQTEGTAVACEICGTQHIVFPCTPQKYRRKCCICKLEGRRLPNRKKAPSKGGQ
jgi:hypothetical protein